MRARMLAPAALLLLGAVTACGDSGTSVGTDGVTQKIAGTPCVQRGINIGEAGTTECTFENGVILSHNDTDGVTIKGNPSQLPENCVLDQGSTWNNGTLQGGLTCTWNGVAVTYNSTNGVQVGAPPQPTPTA